MEYLFHMLVIAGIYVILTLSLNLMVGFTGLAALGHAAFACVGAYTSSVLALRYGLSPWLGLLAGGCLAALTGLVIGTATRGLKGDYLALATFGFGVILYSVAQNWVSLTGGPAGLPGIPGFVLLGVPLSRAWQYFFLVGGFAVLTYAVLWRITHSPFGQVLRGIREDPIAVLAVGKDVNRHRLQVFAIGAAFAGIGGSLYAHYLSYIDPRSFTAMESIAILLMVVFGGLGSLNGSLVGAAVLVLFPELLRLLGLPSAIAAPVRQMIYGLLLVALMLKRPQGMLGRYHFR